MNADADPLMLESMKPHRKLRPAYDLITTWNRLAVVFACIVFCLPVGFLASLGKAFTGSATD